MTATFDARPDDDDAGLPDLLALAHDTTHDLRIDGVACDAALPARQRATLH